MENDNGIMGSKDIGFRRMVLYGRQAFAERFWGQWGMMEHKTVGMGGIAEQTYEDMEVYIG